MYKNPRVLLYSHDTFGLGHLRRNLSIAKQLNQDIPGIHQLLMTGSMVVGAFGLPSRLDMIKLPAISKRSSGQYKSRALPTTLKQTLAWREQMILQSVINFRPNLVLVDKVADGVRGELLPALRHLKTWSPQTKLVLGMRDIEDSPEQTRAEWAANGTVSLHEQVYDHILLYGERELFDPVKAYQMSAEATAKLIPTGYLRRDKPKRASASVRGELGIGDKPLVLVTVGGGGDGLEIIQTYQNMLASLPGDPTFHSLIVTGPLMSRKSRILIKRGLISEHATLIEFTPDLLSYMAVADLVISMAGYNTTCEILSLKKRALLIPRVKVREEQLMRAERLQQCGLAHMLHPKALNPESMAEAVHTAMASPPPVVNLNMNGLECISEAVREMLAESYIVREPGGSNHGGNQNKISQSSLSPMMAPPQSKLTFAHYGYA